MNKEELKKIIIENIGSLKDYEVNEIYNLIIDEVNLREVRKNGQEDLYLNG